MRKQRHDLIKKNLAQKYVVNNRREVQKKMRVRTTFLFSET